MTALDTTTPSFLRSAWERRHGCSATTAAREDAERPECPFPRRAWERGDGRRGSEKKDLRGNSDSAALRPFQPGGRGASAQCVPALRAGTRGPHAGPLVACLVTLGLLLFSARSALGYIESGYSLGKVINDSSNVLLMRVEQVDKQRNLIIYRKVQDIKGKHPGETIKHVIGQGGFAPREWQNIMAWAEVGKSAVFFHNGGIGETCIDNYWYQSPSGGDWWNMNHAEPYLLRTYCGKPERLAAAIAAMLTGKEVTVPCMADGDKNTLQLRTAKIQRMKASLKIDDYNPKRDFVEGGADETEFRVLAGMPGFTHILSLARVGTEAAGIAPANFDGDAKVDLCLFGVGRVALLQNRGASLDEVPLGLDCGARTAAWADYDGDGKLDLLLATPAGLRLLHNDGKKLEDASALLPESPYANITAAAWIDSEGDGRPDILLADGFRGLRLLRNTGKAGPAGNPQLGKWYFAGPFENRAKRGFRTVYPPEQQIDLQRQYGGKNGEKVAWREGNFRDGQNNALGLFKPECNNHCVVYLYREIDAAGAGELPVSMGADDNFIFWLNGQRLYAENVARGCGPDQAQLRLKLRQGKNALLMKVCQTEGDFAFYFAVKEPQPAAGAPPPAPLTYTKRWFEDVSDAVGLGSGGAGAGLKGDCLTVVDVNGDNRPDFLYSAGAGVLVLNTPQGFVEVKDCGVRYQPGGVTPLFGDFNADGRPDLLAPQRAGCRLFRNEGNGRFTDVTAQSGDLAGPMADARSAAWVAYGKPATSPALPKGEGMPDVIVGCMKGPNRYFHNNGNGTFTDATERIGLGQRIFCTRAVAVVDLNNDKVPDVVFNNEGQEAAALLTSPQWPTEVATFGSPTAGNVAVQNAPRGETKPPPAPAMNPGPEQPPSRQADQVADLNAPQPAWQHRDRPRKAINKTRLSEGIADRTEDLLWGTSGVVAVLVLVLYMARPKGVGAW